MIRKNYRFVSVMVLVLALVVSFAPGAFAQDVPEAFAGDEAPTVIVVRQLADGAFMSRYLAGVWQHGR
ncbi:MAG: hypothetical protein AAGK74_07900 [Chloroflexota bacterium]